MAMECETGPSLGPRGGEWLACPGGSCVGALEGSVRGPLQSTHHLKGKEGGGGLQCLQLWRSPCYHQWTVQLSASPVARRDQSMAETMLLNWEMAGVTLALCRGSLTHLSWLDPQLPDVSIPRGVNSALSRFLQVPGPWGRQGG